MSLTKLLFCLVCAVCLYVAGEKFYLTYFAAVEAEESYVPPPAVQYIPQKVPTSIIMDRQTEEEPRLMSWKQANLTPFHAVDGTLDFLATDEVNTVWLVYWTADGDAQALIMPDLRRGYFISTLTVYPSPYIAYYLKGKWGEAPDHTLVAISGDPSTANIYAADGRRLRLSHDELMRLQKPEEEGGGR